MLSLEVVGLAGSIVLDFTSLVCKWIAYNKPHSFNTITIVMNELNPLDVSPGKSIHCLVLGKWLLKNQLYYIVYDLVSNKVFYINGKEMEMNKTMSVFNNVRNVFARRMKKDGTKTIYIKAFGNFFIYVQDDLPYFGIYNNGATNSIKNMNGFKTYYGYNYMNDDRNDGNNDNGDNDVNDDMEDNDCNDGNCNRTIKRKQKSSKGLLDLGDNEKRMVVFNKNIPSALGRKRKKSDPNAAALEVENVLNNYGTIIDIAKIDPNKIGGAFINKQKLVGQSKRMCKQLSLSDLSLDGIKLIGIEEIVNEYKNGNNIIRPDHLPNIDIVKRMQDLNWKLDSKKDQITCHKNIETHDMETDIDSIVLVLREYNEQLHADIMKTEIINCDKYDLKNFMSEINSFKSDNKLPTIKEKDCTVEDEALQIVSFFQVCINESERNCKSIIVDSSKMDMNSEKSKAPTIGLFPTKVGDGKSMCLIPLPSPKGAGNEPQYSWIYGRKVNRKDFNYCLRQISFALLLVLKPADYTKVLQNMCSTEPTYTNNAVHVPAGIWLGRLSFLFYQFRFSKEIAYIEETYHGKARSSNIFFEYKKCLDNTKNNKDSTVSKTLATWLLKKCKGSHVDSMFRLYSSNFFNTEMILGIGIQFEGKLKNSEKKIYFSMDLKEDKEKNNKTTSYYTFGSLPKEISAYTQLNRSISDDIGLKPLYNVLQKNVATEVREQVYSSSFRQSTGEYNTKYEDRASTKIRIERASIETANKFSPAYMIDHIVNYTSCAVTNIASFRERGGFRVETAYYFPSPKTIRKYDPNVYFRDIDLENKDDLIHGLGMCINQSLLNIRSRVKAHDLSVIANYMALQQSMYIKLYNDGIDTLKYSTHLNKYDRLSLFLHNKQMQIQLSNFYSGIGEESNSKTKKNTEDEIADYLGRNVLCTMPYALNKFITKSTNKNSNNNNNNNNIINGNNNNSNYVVL